MNSPEHSTEIQELLLKALRDLEVGANTVDYCYSHNPGNFAAVLRDLREYAEAARAAITKALGST